MKITLIRTPFFNLLGYLKPVYPLGLGYIAAVLKQQGHEVTLVDGEVMAFPELDLSRNKVMQIMTHFNQYRRLQQGFKSLEHVISDPLHPVWKKLVDVVSDTNPDLIGIGCYTSDVPSLWRLTVLLKRRMPQVPIVLGGVHPTSEPEKTMHFLSEVDYIVVGEGEDTIVELCKVLSENHTATADKVAGVYYREGQFCKYTGPRLRISDLDRLPFPDRNLGNRQDYSPADILLTARGCPFTCKFCAANIVWTRRVRSRGMDRVLDELDSLINLNNSRRIRIGDDIFALDKKRVINFCKKVKERGLQKRITLSLGSRVDTIDAEMIEHLASIGTDTISFGIESGSPRILGEISKNITPDQVEKTVRLTTSYGINCFCHFMIGHPGETVDDVKMSIALFQRIANRFVDADLNISTPYPGTELWDIAQSNGWTIQPQDSHNLFHQGQLIVNLTKMSDTELKDYYHSFKRHIVRHGIICKVNSTIRLALKGKINLAFIRRLIGG